ncbi:MAG TPA: TonB family protein [Steroidobacteraceae bacterium]|nr:TonB family protein [Steroidobacteraceae bacterium]
MRPLAQERSFGADGKNSRLERLDAVVICNDDTLLIELGSLLGERFRTHTVDSPAEIATAVSAPHWVGIVDVESLPDARAAVLRMETQFPRCPLILVVPRPAEWSAAVARGTAVAAVAREDMVGPRLVEALTAAESRLRADSESVSPTSHAPEDAGARGGAALRSNARWIAIVAVAIAGLLAGTGWWALHRSRSAGAPQSGAAHAAGDTDATAGTQSAAAPAAAKPQSVLELLSAARVAFRDQKLLLPRPDGEPRGDSALELYAQVISQDPSNDEALDGVRRLFEVGKTRIQSDISTGKLDDATRLVGLFRDADVSADELADLSASITAARPRWLEARVQQSIAAGDLKGADQLLGQLTASGADPGAIAQLRRTLQAKGTDEQLTQLTTQMRAAISAGNLLGPAPDDARSRLASMRSVSRTSPLTLAAQRELQTALVARASDALQAGELDSAQRLLSATTELGSFAPATEVRRQVQAALYAAAHPRPVAPPVVTPKPNPPVAAAKAPVVTPPAPPSYIAARPTRPLSVNYPLGQSASGYLIVQFTLEPNGRARDVSVVQSTLPSVFSRVATDAVADGRFDARALSGGQPAQARLRLRFQPAQN